MLNKNHLHPALPFSFIFLFISAPLDAQNADALFQHSENCIACHSHNTSQSGEDISIGYSWRASMMANSGRDPYWHAGVRREAMDHPQFQAAIEDKCSTCHMPMARYHAHQRGGMGEVFSNLAGTNPESHLALDGVSCSVCHQIRPDNFGTRDSFEGGFVVDNTTPLDQRAAYGPYDIDKGRQRIMQSSAAFTPTTGTHIQQSELCGTCHTLYTQSLDKNGNIAGELPEQMPYVEWLHSSYRETNSCQSCHMPEVNEPARISSVVGEYRDNVNRHVFRGGNAFMIGLFAKNRNALGINATVAELEQTALRTREYLASSSARVDILNASMTGTTLAFVVSVTNLGGHKLPTAYPSRRAWLHVTIKDAAGNTVFESGAFNSDGSITGNDNDANGNTYEPHYEVITSPDQVQVYESVMADSENNLTTGLLYGVRYIKDNRLLPAGFDKATVPEDVAVFGGALADRNFNDAGDRVSYRIEVPGNAGAYTVSAELNYQSIGFRWAENLKQYDAAEPARFVSLYRDNAADSRMRLAGAEIRVSD